MIKYKLSVGRMLSSPSGEAKKGKPPVYTISYLYVSEIYDNIDEVRHAADTLIVLSPLHFGFTLVAEQWYPGRLYTFNTNYKSSFYNLANGQADYYRECLMLEIINGPAFYGIMTKDKEYREYVSVKNVYKSKLFAEYRPYIDLGTLKSKYSAETQFTITGNKDALPCITCYTSQNTVYEVRKDM